MECKSTDLKAGFIIYNHNNFNFFEIKSKLTDFFPMNVMDVEQLEKQLEIFISCLMFIRMQILNRYYVHV